MCVFPACECGRRLCDEVTGRCICPPQTVKPSCDVCASQSFSFHPLLGCEGCDCSPSGVNATAGGLGGLDCDNATGQCPWVEPINEPILNSIKPDKTTREELPYLLITLLIPKEILL